MLKERSHITFKGSTANLLDNESMKPISVLQVNLIWQKKHPTLPPTCMLTKSNHSSVSRIPNVELTPLIRSRSQYQGMQSNTVGSNNLVGKQNTQTILQTFCWDTQTQTLGELLEFPGLHSVHFQRRSYNASASTTPEAERVQTFCHHSNCTCTVVPEM
jgi:hypothetical protein